MRNLRIFTGHKIIGRNGTESNYIIEGAEIANDADGFGVGENRKILIRFNPMRFELRAENIIGVSEDVEFLFRNLADNSDCESRSGEGLTIYKCRCETQAFTECSDFIFEERTQRFYNAFKF